MPSRTEPSSGFDASPSRPSGFRSFFSSKLHKRVQSTSGPGSNHCFPDNGRLGPDCFLPPDHPHARAHCPLSERGLNSGLGSSVQSYRPSANTPAGGHSLHKKTKSAVSLRSLLGDRDKKSSPSKNTSSDGSTMLKKTKKTKSTTSLSGLFKKSNKGRRNTTTEKEPDKENAAPTEDAENILSSSPLWSQFERNPHRESFSSRYAHSTQRTLDEEISLYTPREYSPSRQQNFHNFRPSLTKRPDWRPRPKSDLISSNPFFIRDRLGSGNQRWSNNQSGLASPGNVGRSSSSEQSPSQRTRRNSGVTKTSRVLAAISGFGSKEKKTEITKATADPQEIDKAFEDLLDSRDIPHNMRDKMRSLDVTIKADFVAKHVGSTSSGSSGSSSSNSKYRNRMSARSRDKNIAEFFSSSHEGNGSDRSRKSRPRSGNLGLSKIPSSPRKVSRPDSVYSHQRQRSGDMSRPSSKASTKPDETTEPADFVHYMKEVQKPEIVEVGKLHKLRILLRNETVAWVESFISCGGMDELIGLLYRIIKVEWREEHEDALLHEVLLCLKALCTTTPALRRLRDVEKQLFPTLLRLIFGEEKKGPSEYTTRGIVFSLLFTHLSAAGPEELPSRARTILSYLRDPAPSEDSQPLPFIANIYQSRPYRVWCREASNVTKEVFWIFLHHLNVVPVDMSFENPEVSSIPFSKRRFPPPHPPVPAAPYIGGVEWDATNYLAGHVDLINGLIASLPTTEERNSLRADLRASGFEKVMGKSLRTCKEKLYPAVHEGLKLWVSAAAEDGWDYTLVREGPPRNATDSTPCSPVKGNSPMKRAGIVSDTPPKLELDVGSPVKGNTGDHGWI
ncbi:hypothetical protein VTO42DRAFT_2494 [Malbranchea cinnamomea]